MGYIGAGITRFNTADELTVTGDAQIDTTTLVVDSTNNRVGMGTASPDGTTHIHTASAGSVTANTDADDLTVENSGNSGISILSPDANRSAIMLGHASDNLKMQIRHDGSTSLSQIISDDAVTFNVIGGTERMRINDTGVGIGESSPTRNLVIKDTDGQVDIGLVTSNTGVSALMFADTDDSNIGRIQYLHSTNDLTFTTNDSEAVRIDSSQNLLVGTTSDFGVDSTTATGVKIKNNGMGAFYRDGGTPLYVNRGEDGTLVDLRRDGTTVGSIGSRDSSTSYIILKTSSGAGAGLTGSDNRILPMDESALADNNTDLGMSSYRFKDGWFSNRVYTGGIAGENDTNTQITFPGSDVIKFLTGGGEAARLDSSQNLLVGKTASGVANTGAELQSSGFTSITRDGGAPLQLNRKTSDGDLFVAKKDGSTVGVVSVYGADMYIGTDDAGLTFNNSADLIAPVNPSTGATRDDAIDLGATNARFKDLYLSGGAYLGGTGSANHLDDYEEGSGTLTLEDATSGGNVSSTTGTFDYVKIGKVVHLRYNFENISTSGLTSGNSLYAHGLPFTASQNHRGIVFSQFLNVDSGTYDLEFRVNNATTYGFWNMSKDAASGAVVTPSDMTSGSTDMRGSITYFTSS